MRGLQDRLGLIVSALALTLIVIILPNEIEDYKYRKYIEENTIKREVNLSLYETKYIPVPMIYFQNTELDDIIKDNKSSMESEKQDNSGDDNNKEYQKGNTQVTKEDRSGGNANIYKQDTKSDIKDIPSGNKNIKKQDTIYNPTPDTTLYDNQDSKLNMEEERLQYEKLYTRNPENNFIKNIDNSEDTKDIPNKILLGADKSWFKSQHDTGGYSNSNCGPAVVSMVSTLKGKELEVEDIRSQFKISTYMTTEEIKESLSELGYDSNTSIYTGKDVLIEELMNNNIVILCIKGDIVNALNGHYIIVNGYERQNDKEYFYISDPWTSGGKKYGVDIIDKEIKGRWEYYISIPI